MTIYFVLLGVAVLGGFGLCTVWKSRWGRVIYLGAIGLIFTVLAGVRYLTGYDYALYWPTFTQTYNLDWFDLTPSLDRMEKGYLMVNKLFANFTMEGCVIFFVFGAIYAANVVWFIHRYSSNPWMSVAAFLCFGLLFNSFCFMRQYTAAMILMWALIDIKENRPLRFLILVLLASSFHLSALIFLPFYVILKIPLNRVILPFAVMGIIIIVIFAKEYRKTKDPVFRFMPLAVGLSFGFYLPVVLFSGIAPIVGVLMIPKTMAYVWMVCMGLGLYRRTGDKVTAHMA